VSKIQENGFNDAVFCYEPLAEIRIFRPT